MTNKMRKYKVFIDGAEGTTGLEIHQRLKSIQEIEILYIDEYNRKSIDKRLEKISEADLTILCLPDEAAREIAGRIPQDKKVIDTSTAHRTDPNWVYGLPELSSLQYEKIKESNRVSNPGCHATGGILAIRPLIEKEILSPLTPIAITSVTGYSGGGKKMIGRYQDSKRVAYLESPGQYGLTQEHKHLREICKMSGLKTEPSFLPIVGDYYRGMMVSVAINQIMMNKKVSLEELKDLYCEYYEPKEGFNSKVMVCRDIPQSGFLYGNEMANTDEAKIYIYGNDNRPVISVLFDNLGKGASGAAVENLKIMLNME